MCLAIRKQIPTETKNPRLCRIHYQEYGIDCRLYKLFMLYSPKTYILQGQDPETDFKISGLYTKKLGISIKNVLIIFLARWRQSFIS